MIYKTKVIINGVEVLEANNLEQKTPYITNAQLQLLTSLDAMGIGASAADTLTFDMINPYKTTFDGDAVEFFVAAQGDTSANDLGDIEAAVGSDTATEAIDVNDAGGYVDDTEEGEELTPEEALDVAEATLEGINAEYAFYNGEPVAPEQVTTSEETEPQWEKIGTYYVKAANYNEADNTIRLSCVDALAKLTETYKPSQRIATVQAIYNDLAAQITATYGLAVEPYEFDDIYNVQIRWSRDYSYRASFEYLAALVGGIATIGSDDTLGISFYTYHDQIILTDRVSEYATTSAGEMTVNYLACDRSLSPYNEDVIEVGGGQGVTFICPYMTEAMLADIFEMYKGIRYEGAQLVMSWDTSIQSGEFIRIMTPAEYANYVALSNAIASETDATERLRIIENQNTLGRVVLVSNQSITFDGDATSRITSICNTEFSKANPALSPTDAKFKTVYADMIDADMIITNRLEAAEATVGSLEADTAKIKDLTVTTIDGVDYINGHHIADGSVIATALSSETITTLKGVKVFYQFEDPTTMGAVVSDGDTWYKTMETDGSAIIGCYVWNGSAWELHEFDGGEVIRAGTITASEIASNTITSGNLNTTEIFSNKITASDMNITGGSLNINTSDATNDYIRLNATINSPDGGIEKRKASISSEALRMYGDQPDQTNELFATPWSIVLNTQLKGEGLEAVKSHVGVNSDAVYWSGVDLYDKSYDSYIRIDSRGCTYSVRGDSGYKEAFNVSTDGAITVSGHSSPIGTVLDIAHNQTKSLVSGTTFASNTVKSFTLTKGTWIVEAGIQFPALGSTNKNVGMMIYDNTSTYDEDGYLHTTTRYLTASAAVRLHCTGLFSIDTDTRGMSLFAFQNSGSSKTATYWIKAVRIA